MDATLVLVAHDRLDEGPVRLVELPQLHQRSTQRVRVRVQILLRERRSTLLGLGVLQVEGIEHLGHRGAGPRINVHAALVLDHVAQVLGPLPQHHLRLLCPIQIDTDTTRPHLDHERDEAGLQVPDVPEVLLIKFDAQSLPQFQRHDGILLRVAADVLWWHAPHLALGVEPPLFRRSAQEPLVLAHVDVVLAEVVEAIGPAVLIDDGSGDHRVDDPALDVDPLGTQPPSVVGGVVHDLVDVRRGHLPLQPPHGHLGVEVVAVLVTDWEVPVVVASGYSHPDDVAIVARPTGTKRGQMRVVCFKVNGDLLVPGQIRVLGRHGPIDFDVFKEVRLPHP